MKATLTRVSMQKSHHHGGTIWLLCFKCEDGKSRRSWVDPKNGNFKRWEGLLNRMGAVLDELILKGNLVDADSWPKVVGGSNGLDQSQS